jgi:hypothetical protein
MVEDMMYSDWQDTVGLIFLLEEYFRGITWTVSQIKKVMGIFSSSQCSKCIAGSTECPLLAF